MNCVDWEILSHYQDGSLDPERMQEVDEHLQSCEVCQSRFRELGRANLFLRIGMASRRKAECLGEEELGAYLSGRMSLRDRSRVEEHLLICQRCLSEVSAVVGTEFFEPSEGSPVPDDGALSRFIAMAGTTSKTAKPTRRRVLRWSMSAAAALLLALSAGLTWTIMTTSEPVVTAPTEVVAEVVKAEPTAQVVSSAAPPPEVQEQLELVSDLSVLQPDSTDLAAFAREMGDILSSLQNMERHPDAQMLEILKEDVLQSGLVNSLARLTESTRDSEDRRFLANCRDVLMRVVQLDRDTLDAKLPALLKDIRDLNLIETARLLELERGTAPWLAML